MEALHQTHLNSFLLSKIKFVLIFSAFFLSSNFIVSEIFAKEEIRYVKGLGAVLREQPSILSKKLTKLSRGTKILAIEAKGIWHKVIAGGIQGWLVRGQITNIPVKIKKSVLGQKIRLTSSSGRRIRLRTFSAIVGVKGLVDSKGNKISPYQTDYAALEWLENQPSDEENSVLFLTLTE